MHSRKLNRLKPYDYSMPGYYFVTICTDNRKLFGSLRNGELKINKKGKLVKQKWIEIPNHFKDVELDEYVIMPNHIHGIIIINENVGDTKYNLNVGDAKFASPTDRTKMLLSVIIQQFKRICTIELKRYFEIPYKIWQRSFYDRIIRNEKELHHIRRYIKQNPLKLTLDMEIPENIDL